MVLTTLAHGGAVGAVLATAIFMPASDERTIPRWAFSIVLALAALMLVFDFITRALSGRVGGV